MKTKKPLKPALTVEQVMDLLLDDMTHTCDGWATVIHCPVLEVKGSFNPAHRAFFFFKVPQYNTEEKTFKITIEEAWSSFWIPLY